MDSLDIRLLRALFRGHVFNLRGVDPRASVQQLARDVGASRVTVRRRLDRWRTDGFWNGQTVFPNPFELRTRFQMQAFLLNAGRHQQRLESAIRHVIEPMISFQSGDVYTPILLAESDPKAARRQAALRPGRAFRVLCSPVDLAFPPPKIRLTPRDWKILIALRRAPEPDWQAVAREVGVTPWGLSRRVTQLMQGDALFFFPLLDFRHSEGSVVWVGLLFGPGVDGAQVWEEVRSRYPDALPVEAIFPFEIFIPSAARPRIGGGFPFFVPSPSASSADEIRRELSAIPGVVNVLTGFPTQNTAAPEVLDRRIEVAARRAKPPRSGPLRQN